MNGLSNSSAWREAKQVIGVGSEAKEAFHFNVNGHASAATNLISLACHTDVADESHRI